MTHPLMKAFVAEDPETAPALIDLPTPLPARGEVQVRIDACGLNFADLLLAKGTYQDKRPHPVTLGMELAGTITALGTDVQGLFAGQRVAVFAGAGGLAEVGCFPADRCVPLPDAMPVEVAAGFLVAYGSSHLALIRAGLTAGETLLVLGAAGGVGLTAVEIGTLMGARVIACARGPEKATIARKAGAVEVLDSDDPDLKAKLKALGGVDVVYDPVGGALYRPALSALKPEGRYLLIGFASGTLPQIAANHLLVKNVSVIGFWWGGYLSFNPDAVTDSLRTLFDWYVAGRIAPHISEVLPLEHVTEGLERLRSRAATGKIVIRCQPDGHQSAR